MNIPASPVYEPFKMLPYYVDTSNTAWPPRYDMSDNGYSELVKLDTPQAVHLKIRVLARDSCPCSPPLTFRFKGHEKGCLMPDHEAIDQFALEAAKQLNCVFADWDGFIAEMKRRFSATHEDMLAMNPDDNHILLQPLTYMERYKELLEVEDKFEAIDQTTRALAAFNCTGCFYGYRDNQTSHEFGCLADLEETVFWYFDAALNDLNIVPEDKQAYFEEFKMFMKQKYIHWNLMLE